MAETTETGMTVNDLDLFANDNVAKDREDGEHGRHRSFSIDDQERHMVDLEAIREIVNTGPAFVCIGYHDDFVSSIYEFCGQLIHVTFNTSWLWEEVITDHGDVVRHLE